MATVDGRNVVTIEATEVYRDLVSVDNEHEAGWCAWIQAERPVVTKRHENQFTGTLQWKGIVFQHRMGLHAGHDPVDSH